MTIAPAEIARLLRPFALALDDRQLDLVARYADLLVRWNRAVNLTAIRQSDEMMARHFGESLFVAGFAEVKGPLLDVGSGAGFPGLAIKIVLPEVPMVLLEPVAKKRAFLKEVSRECGFRQVEVVGARVEDYCAGHSGEFESVTLRAVGDFEGVLPAVWRCLSDEGRLYAWLTHSEANALHDRLPEFRDLFAWTDSVGVPLSRDREIWVGSRCSGRNLGPGS
jgi:16S rRNA (guanine527-N7)-methyltransferase